MNNSEKKTNLKFYVGGMTCSACSARVDKVVTAVEGAECKSAQAFHDVKYR